MVRKRLLAVIQASPFWFSRRPPGLPVETNKTDPADGLDCAWYFRTYRRSWAAALLRSADSAVHYQLHRARFAVSPNLAFDEFWYRHLYSEIDTLVRSGAVASGWDHYLNRGCLENRNPAWWFDEKWYREKNPEVEDAVKMGHMACGFEHYLLYGMRRNLSPSLYFDAAWYQREYLVGADCHAYPVLDYLLTSNRSTRCPAPFFDSDWYRTTYLSKVLDPVACEPPRWQSPYEHYILWGRNNQLSPSPKFNERGYRELNCDAVEKIAAGRYVSGFEHYVHEGAAAGAAVPTHLNTAGVDYTGPAFLETYEKSLRLNLKQLRLLKNLLNNGP